MADIYLAPVSNIYLNVGGAAKEVGAYIGANGQTFPVYRAYVVSDYVSRVVICDELGNPVTNVPISTSEPWARQYTAKVYRNGTPVPDAKVAWSVNSEPKNTVIDENGILRGGDAKFEYIRVRAASVTTPSVFDEIDVPSFYANINVEGEYCYVVRGNRDYMFFTEHSSADIEWGDGTTDGHSCSSSHSHTYQTSGDWVVLFHNFSGGRFTYKNYPLYIVYVLTPLPAMTTTSVAEMYMGCANLLSVPQNFLIHNPQITNFTDMFSGCTSLSGEIPRLWELYPTATGTRCFRGCTNLSNYDEIPNAWR
ncbi:hypothetical protein AGMMS49975_14070 [Clostridia bacterium]|nr:hypothetical protein AGMMS49975_14070 [Clostridia bacterium]